MSVTTARSYLSVLALSLVVSNRLGGYRTEKNTAKISSEQAMLSLAKLDVIDVQLTSSEVELLYDMYYFFEQLAQVKLTESNRDMWAQLVTCYNTGVADDSDFSVIAKLPALFAATTEDRLVEVFEKRAISHSVWTNNQRVHPSLAYVYKVSKCKNFNGYNVFASVDQKLVTWFSKNPIRKGIINVSGSVKSQSQSIDDSRTITRLQYVKVTPAKLTFTFGRPAVTSNSTTDLPWD